MCRFMSLTMMDDPDLILDLTLMHCDRPGELSWTCEKLYNAERKCVADLKALLKPGQISFCGNTKPHHWHPQPGSCVHPVPVPLCTSGSSKSPLTLGRISLHESCNVHRWHSQPGPYVHPVPVLVCRHGSTKHLPTSWKDTCTRAS